MEKDLGLEGLEFNTCLAVCELMPLRMRWWLKAGRLTTYHNPRHYTVYIFYILAEIPSNLVLKRVGANVWLPAIIIAWGTVTTLTGIVESYAGLLVVRSVLGLTEGGLLPGMTLYLSTLYPRGGLQKRIAFVSIRRKNCR